MGLEIFYNLKKVFYDRNLSMVVGDEGGFVLILNGMEDVLEIIVFVIKNVGYKLGDEVMIVLDCVLVEFYVNGKYDYIKFEGDKGKVCFLKE